MAVKPASASSRARSRIGASTAVMVGSTSTPARGRSACAICPQTRPELICSVRIILASDQLAHDLGGVVHHRDNSRIVKPGRPDDADDADDTAGAVVIG